METPSLPPGSAGIDSEAVVSSSPAGEPLPQSAGEASVSSYTDLGFDDGDAVDAAIPSGGTVVTFGRGGGRDKKSDDEKPPKAGPPTLDEWMKFFSGILVKGLTEGYIQLVFRDVDENLLTDREVEKIQMTDAERDRIAKPFAELANKLKITRKHGRTVISAAGTVDSLWAIGIWMGRVNRIAMKYRPTRTVRGKVVHSHTETPHERSGSGPAPSANGTGGYTVFNPGSG